MFSSESTVRETHGCLLGLWEGRGLLVYCLLNGLSQKNRKEDSFLGLEVVGLRDEEDHLFGREDLRSSLEPIVLR